MADLCVVVVLASPIEVGLKPYSGSLQVVVRSRSTACMPLIAPCLKFFGPDCFVVGAIKMLRKSEGCVPLVRGVAAVLVFLLGIVRTPVNRGT